MMKTDSGMHLRLLAGLMATLSIAGCSSEQPLSGTSASRSASAVQSAVSATTTVLAVIADDERPHTSKPFHVVFSERGHGVAYVAASGGQVHVVHNGKPGKSYKEINDSKLAISPDGQRIAYAALVDNRMIMVVDGQEDAPEISNVGPPVFSPDSRHIAYEAQVGDKWHVVVDGKRGPARGSFYMKPQFSGNARRILTVENPVDGKTIRLVVSDLDFGRATFLGASGYQYVLNRDRTKVASVQHVDKKQRVIEFTVNEPAVVKEGRIYDIIRKLTFSPDGTVVAYGAVREGLCLLVLGDREEPCPEGDLISPLVVRPDNKVVGAIVVSSTGFSLHEAFFQGAARENKHEGAGDLVYSPDGSRHAYIATAGKQEYVVVNGAASKKYDRVVAPVFSPDGTSLVFRARKDGKRFVIVADRNGKVLNQHRAYEQVFEPVFPDDGKSVAYGVKDGKNVIWQVEKLRQ